MMGLERGGADRDVVELGPDGAGTWWSWDVVGRGRGGAGTWWG